MDPGEGCDEGAGNSDERPGACRSGCTPAGCGDGVVDPGEGCDDGNTAEGDGCSSTCVAVPVPLDPDGWECFEEDLASCRPCSHCHCSTQDSVDACDPHSPGEYVTPPDSILVHTGQTGYCGYGGIRQVVEVPDATPVFLAFASKASCDRYASRAGVALEHGGERTWLLVYSREGGGWTETFAPLDRWAGEVVSIEVFVEDAGTDWCDMGDHSFQIRADDFRLTRVSNQGGL